jgi:hypothetical protein
MENYYYYYYYYYYVIIIIKQLKGETYLHDTRRFTANTG